MPLNAIKIGAKEPIGMYRKTKRDFRSVKIGGD